VYVPAIHQFHAAFGAYVYEWAVRMYPQNTAAAGNSTVAAAVILCTVVLAGVLVRVLRTWSERFRVFLLGQ
jgi:hypothetical protein